MFARTFSTAINGADAKEIQIESSLSSGLQKFNIVGLPDTSLKESKHRVRSAINRSSFYFPNSDLVVSLSPASLPKLGPSFELAIALSILGADQQIPSTYFSRYFILGELALDGTVLPVNGALAASCLSKTHRIDSLIIPFENLDECTLVKGTNLYPVSNLTQAVATLANPTPTPWTKPPKKRIRTKTISTFADVVGQYSAKQALEISAGGGHNVLFVGPPGAGKSMLSARLPSILPDMNEDEAIEVLKIQSASTIQPSRQRLPLRPFRSPHHTISSAALLGGGSNPKPGELSLAHKGVLFLDELPEFKRDCIESLRAPLEEKEVHISRAEHKTMYPADCIVIAAMNPCPCGYYKQENKRCSCTGQEIKKYQNKVSGPILDRFDLHVNLKPVDNKSCLNPKTEDLTEDMRDRVKAARNLQSKRFNSTTKLNSSMTNAEIKKYCKLSDKNQELLLNFSNKYDLSARAINRTLKISRTIADLNNSEEVSFDHLSIALNFRLPEMG